MLSLYCVGRTWPSQCRCTVVSHLSSPVPSGAAPPLARVPRCEQCCHARPPPWGLLLRTRPWPLSAAVAWCSHHPLLPPSLPALGEPRIPWASFHLENFPLLPVRWKPGLGEPPVPPSRASRLAAAESRLGAFPAVAPATLVLGRPAWCVLLRWRSCSPQPRSDPARQVLLLGRGVHGGSLHSARVVVLLLTWLKELMIPAFLR